MSMRSIVFAGVLAGTAILSATQAAAKVVHNSWSSGANMPTAREGAAVGAIKTKIYVAGGRNGVFLAVNEIYDTVLNTWTTGAPMPTPDWGVGAVVRGELYAIGSGGEVQKYNPVTNKWKTKGLAPMPTVRDSLAAAVYQGKIYVIGGFAGIRLTTVESYDPASNTWTELAPMLVGKSLPVVGKLGSGMIVAAGGFTNNGVTGDTEVYDIATNSWRTVTADPTVRQAGCGWDINGKLYFASGDEGPGYDEATYLVESFTLKTQTWTTPLAPLPQSTVYPGSADVGGRIFCMGGATNGDRELNNVQIYQP